MVRWYGVTALITALLCLLVSDSWAHPDLMLQIEELTAQLVQQPGNAALLLKRGDLQRRHENWDLARADFRRVREVQPDNGLIDWFEGRLAVETGQPDLAVQYLNRFLKKNPGHSIALQNRAQAYLLLHQPVLAAQDYELVIHGNDKAGPTLYSANALALIEAGSEYFSQALAVVRSGLVKFPSEILLTGISTDVSLARADTQAASDLIKQLPAAIQGLPQWQARQALLDCETGQREKAAQWFTDAQNELQRSRTRPPFLTVEWQQRLAANPGKENCQAAVIEKLRRH